MALFKMEGISFKYPEQEKIILKDIHLEIQEGDFVTICGKSGCGKTTLLRHLKPVLTPYGMQKGTVYFKNKPLKTLDIRSQTMKIGYVLQNPEQQIVTDKVWHELAFGLESLGYDSQTIRLRVAEMASFFGIQHWFHKAVSELSGGQKQILNLAAIMVMQPEVLVLDEPTAQLDPIATKNFIEMLKRINMELGTTIILSEHHLEEVLPISDEVIVMEKGAILIQGTVEEVGMHLSLINHELFKAMPVAMQVTGELRKLTGEKLSAVTVREGRKCLKVCLKKEYMKEFKFKQTATNSLKYGLIHQVIKSKSKDLKQEEILRLKEIYFRYEKNSQDILKGISWGIKKGNLYAIVGGNGTGKTTMLSVLSGIYKPYRGKVKWLNKNMKVSMLPQNPSELFHASTVREELLEMLKDLPESRQKESLAEVIQLFELEELLEMHPYDLSGGQMQFIALAKVLLLKPEVMLLDEPTKGMDIQSKERLGTIFEKLKQSGVTLVMVSHDLDFCAKYSDECALFFDGQIISHNKTKEFFVGNNFYTTAAHRMSRGLLEDCVTSEEVTLGCQIHFINEGIDG